MATDLTPSTTVFDETGERAFLFSVIIPVYNTADYVGEAIESIMRQTVGFERYIQLVLVNDGSTDGSGEICAAWQKRYPANIVYVDKENEGVSVARNVALSLCRGDYVNCLDSDDYWSLDAFECAAQFFLEHPDVNITTARHEFFGRLCNPHALTYKFYVDKVVDIMERFDYPQLSFSNAFVRRELIPEAPFNPSLKISEDFSIINTILLDERRYGIMAAPTYYYRKRDEATSAIDTAMGNLSWYFETPELCYRSLMEKSRAKFGQVIPYIQSCVMYDLQWRLQQKAGCPLDDAQMERYRALVVGLLRDIDDDVILMQRNLLHEEKLLALSLKYGVSVEELQRQLHIEGDHVVWDGAGGTLPFYGTDFERIARFEFAKTLRCTQDDAQEGIHIAGRLSTMCAQENVRMTAVLGKREFKCDLSPYYELSKSSVFERRYYVPLKFEVVVPVGDITSCTELSFELELCGQRIPVEITFGKFFPVQDPTGSYARLGNVILSTTKGGKRFLVEPYDTQAGRKHELAISAGVLLGRKDIVKYLSFRPLAAHADNAAWLAEQAGKDGVGADAEGGKRRVWLLSDRPNLANDNGEAMFEHLQEHPIDGVDTYFVLQKTSPDYARLCKIGKVVPYGSREHFALTLRAEVVASSSGDDIVFNPFGRGDRVLSGLMHAKFVFLQHGITKDDLSEWIRKSNKNVSLFVTAAPREKASIVDNPCYGYTDDEVLCSGFPRHDKLLAAGARKQTEAAAADGVGQLKRLMIAPTWRNYLAQPVDPETGMRPENPNFEKSEYFRFYNGLLNDTRLAEAAKRTGFEIRYLMHPSFIQELHKFTSDFCTIVTKYDYADEMSSAGIMLTDYSSVAFDFALLKRPVAYAQTDPSTFFAGHTYEQGYYSYERDGFGPICASYDETVEQLIAYMENPVMEDEYVKRVDEFFFWPDEPRCKIVADAIEKMVAESR